MKTGIIQTTSRWPAKGKIRMWCTALFTFIFSLFICSCDKDENGADAGNPVAVQFGTGNIATTRTTTDSNGETEWKQDDRIGIFMIGKDVTAISGNIKENADNIEYKADAGGSTQTGFSAVDGTIYYPNNGEKVDFIAYYPYKPKGSGAGEIEDYLYPIDVSNQTTLADIDVLYSKNAKNKDKTSGTVDLQFSHALSKLDVKVVAGEGNPSLSGLSITIEGRYQRADLSLSDGITFTDNQNGNIVMCAVTAGEKYEAILIPQAGVSGSKAVLKVGSDTYDWDISGINFLPGKKYSYTITVNKTGISVSVGNITDWTDKDTAPTEGVGGVYYKVGDYYPDPTNTSTAIGVVFWVDPADGKHGKVVSLDEKTGVRWDNGYYNTGARDLTNGRVNMHTISEFIESQTKAWSNFPAFDWVHTTKNAGTSDYSQDATDIWYLPAKNELQALYAGYSGKVYEDISNWYDYSSMPDYDTPACQDARNAFNNKLQAAGGTAISQTYYWASSESDANYAGIVHFGIGYVGNFIKDGGNGLGARAVLAF